MLFGFGYLFCKKFLFEVFLLPVPGSKSHIAMLDPNHCDWLPRNDLSQYYLDEIAAHIIKNTGGQTLG